MACRLAKAVARQPPAVNGQDERFAPLTAAARRAFRQTRRASTDCACPPIQILAIVDIGFSTGDVVGCAPFQGVPAGCCIPPIFVRKALPNKIPMGQNERNAKSGTSVESCSLLLQASLHFTTDIFPAKSRVRICKHFVNELPSPAVRCCDFFSVFMASQQRDYDIPMVTLALPLVRLDRSVFSPLPLLQSQKRFLAKSQIVF